MGVCHFLGSVSLQQKLEAMGGPVLQFSSVPGDEQGGLACCGSWGHKELDKTERLN